MTPSINPYAHTLTGYRTRHQHDASVVVREHGATGHRPFRSNLDEAWRIGLVHSRLLETNPRHFQVIGKKLLGGGGQRLSKPLWWHTCPERFKLTHGFLTTTRLESRINLLTKLGHQLLFMLRKSVYELTPD